MDALGKFQDAAKNLAAPSCPIMIMAEEEEAGVFVAGLFGIINHESLGSKRNAD